MKSTDFIVESIGEDADAMHRDHEVQMARSDCYHAAKYAIDLHKMLQNVSEEQGLEGWVSEKITLACDYLRTVQEHLEHQSTMSQELAMPAFTFEGAEQQLAEGLDDPKSNPCWDDYEPVGTKKKNGKTVPNCVPKNESAEPEDEELFGQDDTAGHYRAVQGMRRGGNEGGMSLMGYVVTDYATLEKVFGEPDWGPSEDNDDKVTCLWSITFGDDERTKATVYDWKTGGTPMGTHRWHVGGFEQKAVELVEAAIKIGGKSQEVAENMGQNGQYQKAYRMGRSDAEQGKPNQSPWADKNSPAYDTSKQGYNDGHNEFKQPKKQVSEMTAGGTGAGGFATGPTGGSFKKTTGVPKKIKNPVKRTTPQIGKGIY